MKIHYRVPRLIMVTSFWLSVSLFGFVAHAQQATEFGQTPSQLQQGFLEHSGCEENELCEAIAEYCDDNPQSCWALIITCIRDEEQCETLLFDSECAEEDCREPDECTDEEEGCREPDECTDEEEDCREPDECTDEEEDCREPDECTDEEHGCEYIVSGYSNPNPMPDMTVMTVETEAANRASRFLHQATLGANYPLITLVASMGEEAWLETQFEQPIGYLFPYTEYLWQTDLENEVDGESTELFGSPVQFHFHAWWTQVMTSPDLVRQRVAMALSEIFVISSNVEVIGESPFAITQYYDTLLTHSFGNFRELLKAITLNPAMAIYLSHLNNEKANPETGTFPDENYAREVMQLFSIGLYELNQDGTRKKNANGEDIPTYGQDEIREFAKIFTGLSMVYEEGGFGSVPCCNEDFYESAKNMTPLQMFDSFHSGGEKKLLNGFVVPSGQSGMQDIEDAIDNLFNHPNVGPFIGKQLIQRLVTSNPSPDYVARVSAAFNGENGSPRGDMKATLRAILLDEEAREAGRLREPFLRLVRLNRMFDAETPDRNYAGEGFELAAKLKQYVLFSPSVFNFFQPDYAPNGEIKDAGLVAPEFQITTASTIIEIKNLIDLWVQNGRFDDPVGQLEPQQVYFDSETELAEDPAALLERLDTLMTYGSLSDNTREVIMTVIEEEPNLSNRVKKAVYLMAISPDFAVSI